MNFSYKIAIIGGGNIGMAIAQGLVSSAEFAESEIVITRKKSDLPTKTTPEGFVFQDDNIDAVKKSRIIVLAVVPLIAQNVLKEIAPYITPDHIFVSIVTGITIQDISSILQKDICIARAMPNTAIKIRESMTCIAANKVDSAEFSELLALFDLLGKTLVIDEEYVLSATALGSCGIAYFLRSIRAASQGGTQIGFHAEEAQLIAAQTAKGAAELLLQSHSHPEDEIDKVTTPRGVTIAGLNEMEHNGFSSALIKGIVRSYEKALEKNK